MARTRTISGRDLRPGDVVQNLAGKNRTLTAAEPYRGSLAPLWDGEARRGTFDGHWRMTIGPSDLFEVVEVEDPTACQNGDACVDGWIECWAPGGPCPTPNDPACDLCGTCLDCASAGDRP